MRNKVFGKENKKKEHKDNCKKNYDHHYRMYDLRDDMLLVRNNGLVNLEIESEWKIVIIKKLIFLILLSVKDNWKLSCDLNIYNDCRIYKETNKTTNCLVNKDICNLESII